LLHRKRQGAAHRKLTADRGAYLALADRAAHDLDVANEVEHIPGSNDPLEPHVVDPREQCELAVVLGLRKHRYRTALCERLDHLHAGHDRIAGEMPRAVFVRDRLAGDHALARDELEHLVDEEKGIAVRKDLLDLMLAEGRRHTPTLVTVPLPPDVVLPRLRGSFGRAYYYAVETPSTQELPPEDAPHGAVALAEHQTEGRGRRDRVWIDAPGAGLTFSLVLRPPPPVKRWPELTIVAAEAVAGAIGPGATIKEPNDVLLEGAKVAGVLAQARLPARVVVGIGVNVGVAPWEGAAAVDADRLELLVEILARLERGYDGWVRERSAGAWLVRQDP